MIQKVVAMGDEKQTSFKKRYGMFVQNKVKAYKDYHGKLFDKFIKLLSDPLSLTEKREKGFEDIEQKMLYDQGREDVSFILERDPRGNELLSQEARKEVKNYLKNDPSLAPLSGAVAVVRGTEIMIAATITAMSMLFDCTIGAAIKALKNESLKEKKAPGPGQS